MELRLEQQKYINQCWHCSSYACLAYVDLSSVSYMRLQEENMAS